MANVAVLRTILAAPAALTLLATACSGGGGGLGAERQPCRKPAGDAAVCDPGLTCMSDRCVRPPPADCAAVAESLVSIELGNYAPREQRTALAPAKRALCEKHRVSAVEAECLAKATDPWSASACVPRMFPTAEATGCEPVIAKLRAAILGPAGSDPGGRVMLDKMVAILNRSCVEDAWPEPMRRCILDAPADRPEALAACEKVFPPELMKKIEARMQALTP